MAPSLVGWRTTGGTFSIRLCRPSMGKAGANRPLSAALTEGRPQMKTKTVRMAQGVQARITSARGCWVTARGARASPPLFSWPLSEVERQMVLGCHMRRKPDRKSTRLNSSHSQISYAVFCLKKKKLIHEDT